MSSSEEPERLQMMSPERERALDRQLYADHLAQEHAERRERIATAALQGLLPAVASYDRDTGGLEMPAMEQLGRISVSLADALITALDAKGTP